MIQATDKDSGAKYRTEDKASGQLFVPFAAEYHVEWIQPVPYGLSVGEWHGRVKYDLIVAYQREPAPGFVGFYVDGVMVLFDHFPTTEDLDRAEQAAGLVYARGTVERLDFLIEGDETVAWWRW